jgi:hypothetical protein
MKWFCILILNVEIDPLVLNLKYYRALRSKALCISESTDFSMCNTILRRNNRIPDYA